VFAIFLIFTDLPSHRFSSRSICDVFSFIFFKKNIAQVDIKTAGGDCVRGGCGRCCGGGIYTRIVAGVVSDFREVEWTGGLSVVVKVTVIVINNKIVKVAIWTELLRSEGCTSIVKRTQRRRAL
jgi:hypothetical protein